MIKITTLSTGILFDNSLLPGAGTKFAKKYFRPKNFPNINFVSLFDTYVIGSSAMGEDFILTLDGSNNSYPISEINTENVNNLDDLFTKFINALC
jgi:hypothetical protein